MEICTQWISLLFSVHHPYIYILYYILYIPWVICGDYDIPLVMQRLYNKLDQLGSGVYVRGEISNYTALLYFRYIALTMAAELDPEELEEWRTIFNLFDVDGDQSITCQELGVVLRSMGQTPSDQELKEMIKDMDEDGSGTVDFEV